MSEVTPGTSVPSDAPATLPKSDLNLIWIDLEMTGLKTQTDRIIEIAVVVTDPQLTVRIEGPVLAIHQTDEVLNGMDKWNKGTHGKSGLIERVKASTVTEAEAEHAVIAFLKKYVPAHKSPMCGNSICQDRRFLANHMPKLEAFFHYRHLDVSTLKELARRWAPRVLEGVRKQSTHTALSDVRDSIEELKHYRKHLAELAGE